MKTHGKIKNESGVTLITSLLMLVILTGIAVTGYNTSGISQKATTSSVRAKQALLLADAGLQHGKAMLNLNTSTMKNYAYATPTPLIATTQLSSVGSYSVTVQAAGTGGLRLFSTGTSVDGSSVAANESLISLPPPAVLGFAIITGRNLLISGNATTAGTYGGVHANGNLTITGDPTISATATASRTYTVTGHPTISGVSGGGTPVQVVSFDVKAANYYKARDYRLARDGHVYQLKFVTVQGRKNRTTIKLAEVPQIMVGGKWNCWSYNSSFKRWTMDCNTTLNATLYVEGNVLISGNVGTAAAPWIATIIATGSIEVSSTYLYMRPPTPDDMGVGGTSLFKPLSQNMLFIANGDILIDGFSGQTFEGIIAARLQVGITGDPTINGFIYGQDYSTQTNLVKSSYISGQLHLTYNGQYGDLGKIVQ